MSRSKRKAIIKDRPRNKKKSTLYWRRVRRAFKQAVVAGEDPPNPKEIVNDYDYCDYVFDLEHDGGSSWHHREEDKMDKEKYRRK